MVVDVWEYVVFYTAKGTPSRQHLIMKEAVIICRSLTLEALFRCEVNITVSCSFIRQRPLFLRLFGLNYGITRWLQLFKHSLL